MKRKRKEGLFFVSKMKQALRTLLGKRWIRSSAKLSWHMEPHIYQVKKFSDIVLRPTPKKASSLKIFLTALDTKNEGNCFTKLGYQVI